MNALISGDMLTIKTANKSILNTEIELTQEFIQYILNNYKSGKIRRKELERFVPFKKVNALHQADSLLTKKQPCPAKNGCWQSIITTAEKIKNSDFSLAVSAIKKTAGNR